MLALEHFTGYNLSGEGFNSIINENVEWAGNPVECRLLHTSFPGIGVNSQSFAAMMTKLDKVISSALQQRRWALHVAFWAFVVVLYSLFFGQGPHPFWQTLFFVGLLTPVIAGATYLLNYYLVPEYLLQERYLTFFLYFIYVLVGALFLEGCIAMVIFIVTTQGDVKQMSGTLINARFVIAALLMIIFLGVAVKLLSYWRDSKQRLAELSREKAEAELQFLKLQLNPHFLFNTLNNLYSLATEKSDKTPEAILALSELLDYVIHQTSASAVSLKEEIKVARNYIDLEKLRFGDRLAMKWMIDGIPDHAMVPPMTLLTLLENAVKHGPAKSSGAHEITVRIASGEDLRIQVENTYAAKTGEERTGIGLSNLSGQLSLLYPGRHKLSIKDQDSRFVVDVKLLP